MQRGPSGGRASVAGARYRPIARSLAIGNAYERLYQSLHVALGVRGGARNAQQVLRGRRPQHRVDVDALFEQRLAQAAEIDLFPDHHRHDRRLARQHGETARQQFVAQQLRDAQQVQAALRLLAS